MTRHTARFILASSALLAGVAIVLALFFMPVPEENQRVMDMATGLILGWGTLAMGFYFGTSQSSADKTELLEKRPTGEPGDPVHVEPE